MVVMGQERFEEGTGIYGFIIEYDVSALFVEEPTAETIHKYKEHINEFRFIDTEERVISKEQAIELLVKYIKEPKPRCGLIFVDEDIDQRELRSYVSKGNKIPGVNINAKDAIRLIETGVEKVSICLEQEEYTGKSPIEYRNDIRISMFEKLMESREFTVSEAAYLVGFNNMSFFYETYNKYKSLDDI